MKKNVDVILIAGPTASGKTEFSCDIAKKVNGEIINADSMQIYNGLPILTAQPNKKTFEKIPHHLFASIEPHISFSVFQWLEKATEIFLQIKQKKRTAIFVGGTGLYFKALLEGLAQVPPIPQTIRQQVRENLKQQGAEVLYKQLQKLDKKTASHLNKQDGQRIARALEVVLATGCPLSFFHAQQEKSILANLRVQKYLLMPARDILHARINQRCENMVNEGVVEEVKNFMALNLPPEVPLMKAIGVREIHAYIKGESSMKQALEGIKAATRRYGKRQCTWFNNQLSADWQIISQQINL